MYRPPPPNAPGFQGTPPPLPNTWQRPPPPGVVLGTDPMSVPPPPAQLWKEHQNAEGRKYWFNTITRKSTWEKPEELLTPEEKELMNCPWKEYKTPEGKTYYSHAETKESKWSMPEEYKELYEKAEKAKERAAKEAQRPVPPPPQPTPSLPLRPPVPMPMPMSAPTNIVPPPIVSGSNATPMDTTHTMATPSPTITQSPHNKARPDLSTNGTSPSPATTTTTPIITPATPATTTVRPHYHHKVRQPPPSAAILSQVPVVEFPTKEEAEKAFYKLLKETGVKLDWTWEQTMREIITHPIYRALKTPSERKAAFHTYLDKEARRERELREEKESKQRMSFFHMLENTKEIKPYSRYRTMIKSISQQPAYQQIKSETQREQYFEEYVHTLQRREKERLRELRKNNMENFAELLRHIPEITFETKWKEAQQLYMRDPQFENPKAFEGMDMLDFLSVYEEHSRLLWEVPLGELNTKLRERRRTARKARESFRSLLTELVHKGKITARSLWKEVYPEFKDDARYTNLLGVPDSTPFDLFCDLLDDLDEKLYQDKRIVYDILKEFDFEVSLETTYDEYQALLDRRNDLMERTVPSNVKIIFDHLQNKAAQRLKEEKRRQEKKMKKKIDALRHAMKYVDPVINIDDSWEMVRPRIENLPEYEAIENEQQRIEAYEKFIKRLKEKQHADHDEDDEEGMIKEDEEIGGYSKHHSSSSRRYNKQQRREGGGGGSDHESDHAMSGDEERSRRRKKRRTTHQDSFENAVDEGKSSAEEGEALDDYENDPRRLH